MEEINAKYQNESQTEKLKRKTKEAPFVPIGIVGALLGVGYGALKYKYRGKMSTSIYLIHLRVAAQGAVVTAVTVGVAYSLLRDYVFTSKKEDASP